VFGLVVLFYNLAASEIVDEYIRYIYLCANWNIW